MNTNAMPKRLTNRFIADLLYCMAIAMMLYPLPSIIVPVTRIEDRTISK
jgi:hypothetical protein